MSIRTTITLAAAALLLPVALLRADGPVPTDKEKKPPKKVITEDELRSGRSRGTVSVGTPDAQPSAEPAKDGEAAKGEAAAKEEPTDSEKRETHRKEIQEEINYQSANIKSLQDQIDSAQKELNDLTDLSYSTPGTPTGRRAALLKVVDDANAMIKTSTEKIDQLEEEARRAGIAVSRP